MIWIILILLLIAIILRTIRRLRQEGYSYKCFLLTLPKEEARTRRFMSNHNPEVPIEIIYGPDTRDVKVARKFENQIEGEYFEKALECTITPVSKDLTLLTSTLARLGASW